MFAITGYVSNKVIMDISGMHNGNKDAGKIPLLKPGKREMKEDLYGEVSRKSKDMMLYIFKRI